MISVGSALRQVREMIRKTIDDNPSALVVTRAVLVESELGVMAPDPTTARTSVEVRARVAPYPYGIQEQASTEAGLSARDEHFVLVEWDVTLQEDDRFTWGGRVWTLEPPQEITRYGGVAAVQAKAKRADAVELIS